MTFQRTAWIFSAALIALVHGRAMYAQVDQSDLARWILSDFPEQRRTALAAVEKMSPENTGDALRAAMTNALVREADVHRKRHNALRRGEPSGIVEDPEFVAELSLRVVELRDPRAIPALSTALFGPPVVALALANFGEPAAASVLRVVTAPDAWYDDVAGGLISLRFMIEQTVDRPLSPRTISQVRAAVAQRLNGQQHFTILWRAIDLVSVLNDPELERILKRLASDANEVFARGVTDPDLVELTQRRAADRLAGIAPQPRRTDVMAAKL